MADQPKLIIDTDWKAQAQAEKERLAAKAKPAAPSSPAASPTTPTPAVSPAASATPADAPAAGADDDFSDEGAPGERGEIKFQDLVGLLASQAMQFMGFFPDPQTGQAVVSIEYAKLHIDMLGVLEQKTKGNLSEQEQKYLNKVLGQLRMEFVEISKAVMKAMQEGRVRQVGPGGMPTSPGGIVTPGGAPGAGGGLSGPGIVTP